MPNRYVRVFYDAHLPYNARITYDGHIAIPICDPLGRMIEFDRYVSVDGLEYDLHAPFVRAVTSMTGQGLAPIQYNTQRGPAQNGETLLGFFLQPRTVQMTVRANAVSRKDWYDMRRDMINALRPNRATPYKSGTLKKFMPNGDAMCLSCTAFSGPQFEARDPSSWDEHGVNETIQFYAPDPTYFLEATQTREFTGLIPQLVFPTKFPILFGGLDVSTNVIYEGDWPEYPSMNITGPINALAIQNTSTGERLSLSYSIQAGESVTIDLAYGVKTATRSDGTDLTPYLLGDVASWHLAPEPEVDSGLNVVRVTGIESVPGARLLMTWHDRFVGLRMRLA